MFLVAIWTISGNNCYSVTVGAVRNAGPTVRSWAVLTFGGYTPFSDRRQNDELTNHFCFTKKTGMLHQKNIGF